MSTETFSTAAFWTAIKDAQDLVDQQKLSLQTKGSDPDLIKKLDDFRDKLEGALSTYHNLLVELEAINNENVSRLNIEKLKGFLQKIQDFQETIVAISAIKESGLKRQKKETARKIFVQSDLQSDLKIWNSFLEKCNQTITSLNTPLKLKNIEKELDTLSQSLNLPKPASTELKDLTATIKRETTKKKEQYEKEYQYRTSVILTLNSIVASCPILTHPIHLFVWLYGGNQENLKKTADNYQQNLNKLATIESDLESIQKESPKTLNVETAQNKIDSHINELKDLMGSLASDLAIDITIQKKYTSEP